jgi:hypothetical protein
MEIFGVITVTEIVLSKEMFCGPCPAQNMHTCHSISWRRCRWPLCTFSIFRNRWAQEIKNASAWKVNAVHCLCTTSEIASSKYLFNPLKTNQSESESETVSQPVSLGVEPLLGLMTRFLVLPRDYCCLCPLGGAPTLTRGRVCHFSVVFVMIFMSCQNIYSIIYTIHSKICTSLSKCYLRIQSVPQREHHTSPLQRSTG